MSCPQFIAEEVFNCIEMDKSNTYIVVEGNEPSVYDSVLRGLLSIKHKNNPGFVVVSGSDKGRILAFYNRTKANNFFAILDRDFDKPLEQERISYLSRYSLENYLFDDLVVKSILAPVQRKGIHEVKFESNTILSHYEKELSKLLRIIIAYQKDCTIHDIKWSDRRLLSNNCWKVDPIAVNTLWTELSSRAGTTGNDFEKFSDDIPGKLIVKGIYFYVSKELRLSGFQKIYNNYTSFIYALFSAVEYSADFCKALDGAKTFLCARLNMQPT